MDATELDVVIVKAMHEAYDASKEAMEATKRFYEAEDKLIRLSQTASDLGYKEERLKELYLQWADESGVSDTAVTVMERVEEARAEHRENCPECAAEAEEGGAEQ